MKKNREEASASSSLEGPVEVSYTLTSDDVYNALKTSKIYRKNFIKAVIESAILAGLVILFGIWWIAWDDGNAMIFCIACACLIGVVWAAVGFSIRSTCNKMVSGEELHLTVAADGLTIGNGLVSTLQIPLDNTVFCEEKNDVLILYTGENEWTIVPLRIFAPEQQGAVCSTILQHTKRLEK